MNNPSYIVITPARNEEDNIGHTIQSMAAQTCRPAIWVIVNDGSTDKTAEIIDTAARQHPWILPVHRRDRGFRQQGGGVVEAFYDGYARVSSEPWDYLVKFDADLSFEPDFFERCFRKFQEDPRIGIGGGLICHHVNGDLVCESPGDPAFHVRGATKIYRRSCWDAIGGLLRAPGWDTIDELKANMLGWTSRSFKDVPLKHHRYTGTVDGTWKNYVKFGLANYITGYHPLFMALKCIKRCRERPYIIGALGLWWGFSYGYLNRIARVNDPQLIRYVRRQQLNKLILKSSLW
ncbi:MAG TPA: glycosyltransferase family A protein [Opitutaceae bacterium]|nr:glycosyltransferase family A protein [Opitutaceae bacterium]